jgi:hypothetical protein
MAEAGVWRAENIVRIFTRGDGRQFELGRNLGGQVFKAMHCQIDSLLKQRLFDLFGKHPFGADLGERDVDNFVAGGLDDFYRDPVAATFEQALNVMGLGQGELRSAGANAK